MCPRVAVLAGADRFGWVTGRMWLLGQLDPRRRELTRPRGGAARGESNSPSAPQSLDPPDRSYMLDSGCDRVGVIEGGRSRATQARVSSSLQVA